jgi:hypothetical protein
VTKVVGIPTTKKPDAPCLYCGALPPCPDMTCPKCARFELFDDGSLAAVEFFEPGKWKKPVPPDAEKESDA